MPGTPNYRIDLPSLLLGAILLAAVLNIAQFGAIESRAHAGYRVTGHYKRMDLFRVGRHSGIVRHRYDYSRAMSRLAPGSALIVPKDDAPRRRLRYPSDEVVAQMFAFGSVRKLVRADYDPSELLQDFDLKQNLAAKTAGRRGRPRFLKRTFMLFIEGGKKAPRKARRFLLIRRGKRDVYIDTALVPNEVGKLF